MNYLFFAIVQQSLLFAFKCLNLLLVFFFDFKTGFSLNLLGLLTFFCLFFDLHGQIQYHICLFFHEKVIMFDKLLNVLFPLLLQLANLIFRLHLCDTIHLFEFFDLILQLNHLALHVVLFLLLFFFQVVDELIKFGYFVFLVLVDSGDVF